MLTSFFAAPPRCIQAGRVMPGAAHIYIFINTGLYNETGLCQEQHFLLVEGPDAWEREQRNPSHLQRLTQGSHRSAHSLLKSICREDDTMHGYQAACDAWGLLSFYIRAKYSAVSSDI